MLQGFKFSASFLCGDVAFSSIGSWTGGLLEQVAKSCPSNLTGADVSVLCADAYSIAQREHIAKLHELAEGLRVQISAMT